MLQLEDVHVHRGGTHALKGISLSVGRGEAVALIGANGAGKTTTLSAISGLLRPVSGSISYHPDEGGNAVNLVTMRSEHIVASGISLCPEGRQIFGNLSVDENLRIGAYLRKSKTEVDSDVSEMQRLFPILKERARLPGDRLSGGEQMMLAIARALMSKPKLLLLDEPSLGLSPKLVEQVFDILEKIRKTDVTILIVEQNAAMALEFADRAYVIETGNITLSGNASDLADDSEVQHTYLGVTS